MHRRRFVQTATLAGASGLLLTSTTRAHQSSPATPEVQVGDLAARVAQIDPETMLDALLTTPVTTPLLPAGTPPVEPVLWDDPNDTDLAGAVGGVVFNFGYDDNDNFLAIGNAIVQPDAGSATGFVASAGTPKPPGFLGLPWITLAESDYAVSAVQVDYLILVGGSEATNDHDGESDETTGATPASEAGSGSLSLRAISHMTALLDHLEGALASREA